MYISASQIVNWVEKNSRKAQEFIPFLVGQLCCACANTNRIDFPSGDSISKPGFDGFVSTSGDAWVPKGQSVWEIGTNKDITSKASSDFIKRTSELHTDFRSCTTYIFITPRRWTKKSAWVADRKKENCSWLDIRAYDADDLEQWLEQQPMVKVKLLEKIDKSSYYVQSLDEYWLRWAKSCIPTISAESFLAGRNEVAQVFREKLQYTGTSARNVIPIAADSREEAAMFATAALLAEEQLSKKCLMITKQDGWRFIETIPQVVFVIVAYDYATLDLPVKDNLIVIIPMATAALLQSQPNVIKVDRPEIYEYQKALVAIGLTDADARRTALNTGRSWVVFRRHHSADGRVPSPEWASKPEAKVLPILCLLGAWNSHKFGSEWYYDDTSIVSQLACRPYAAVEQDLNYLLSCNDAPVLFLNSVWKAKSPLELFFFFGDKITTDQLERFFEIAERILSEYDPKFELDQDKRWMADSYGKKRRQSNELINALCDSLIKLAVLGAEVPRLNQLSIEPRVRRLIKNLLGDAEPARWLSLHSVLPALAEAYPDIFLASVEKSLAHNKQPIAELMRQSHSGGIGGNCYHAGLLWALETLAWNSSYLSKVTNILANLAVIKTESKWGNTPERSLFNVFCLWFPQTAASAAERFEVLKTVAKDFPDVIVALIHLLVLEKLQHVEHSPKQKWRNDDMGANKRLSQQEIAESQKCLWNYMIEISSENISYSILLLEKINFSKNGEDVDDVINLIKDKKASYSPSEKEKIVQILRKKISTHEFFAKRNPLEQELYALTVKKLSSLIDDLLPPDVLLQNKWLFDAWYIPIKGIDKFDHEHVNAEAFRMRETALEEVLGYGTALLDQLVQECGEPGTIGGLLAHKGEELPLVDWLALQVPKSVTDMQAFKVLSGFFRHRSRETIHGALRHFIGIGEAANWDNAMYVSMFLAAPQLSETWDMLDSCNQEIQDGYWKLIALDFFHDWESRLDYFIAKMTRAGRPRAAVNSLRLFIPKIPAPKLFELMKISLFMEFDDAPLQLQSYDWKKMLERFEDDQTISREELLSFEFNIIHIIQFDCKQAAKTLFERYSSDSQFFLWCIDIAFKHDDPMLKNAPSKYHERIISQSFSVIGGCERLPGQNQSNIVDVEKFKIFVDAVRTGSQEMGKIDGCNIALGYMLVHAPEHTDGTWPPPYVCEFLEPIEQEVLRNQFVVETRNLRGAHMRGYAEGGNQERDLAKRYRAYQEALHIKYPNVSMLMGDIASSYEHDGRREDQEAELRLEGF